MSELINSISSRSDSLFDFSRRLIEGENGKVLVGRYKEVTDSVSATETMEVFDRLLREGFPFEKVKSNVGKIVNVFFKSLNSQKPELPGEGHFLYYLAEENRGAEKLISAFRPCIRSVLKAGKKAEKAELDKLRLFVKDIGKYDLHYLKKENILFPYLEKSFPQYRCLRLMWSFHDDFRRSLKALEIILRSGEPEVAALNSELGKLFFVIIPIIFREEKIVFPVAMRAIPEAGWRDMLEQSAETGWCYGVRPVYAGRTGKTMDVEGKIDLGTGFLGSDQIRLLLNHLPVDVTFVDENDEVCWFSGSEHRIFNRSTAIIGRKVQNCHPHESVHVVNEILDAFKSGVKEHADFWINIKDRFIHIRYFALRDTDGSYKGTIEVSQDVSEIRELKGEQRLPDWKK